MLIAMISSTFLMLIFLSYLTLLYYTNETFSPRLVANRVVITGSLKLLRTADRKKKSIALSAVNYNWNLEQSFFLSRLLDEYKKFY